MADRGSRFRITKKPHRIRLRLEYHYSLETSKRQFVEVSINNTQPHEPITSILCIGALLEAKNVTISSALSAGAKKLCVVAASDLNVFEQYQHVTLLGALSALYTPYDVRQFRHKQNQCYIKVSSLLFYTENKKDGEKVVGHACSVEEGRIVARDIGGGDPEVMAAPNVLCYIKDSSLFSSQVKIKHCSGHANFEKKFPLLAAVNRAAQHVPRHDGNVIKLTYTGEGEIKKLFYFVGKGITFDSGGADIKINGSMIGMHRDKGGAAAVAGIIKVLDILKPKNIKAVGWMPMVRNSVGADCYVVDEVITSRAGVRVRVGNTDAEGRMIMADVLCKSKESALKPKHYSLSPHLFTIATLTGHAQRTYGTSYTAVLDNGPAKKINFAQSLQKAGDVVGDPFEISTIRREDYDGVAPPSGYEDVLQRPVGLATRGHQYPAAFLIIASGLDKHGIDSTKPLFYTHLDIAGSVGQHPHIPTGVTIPALVEQLLT